MINTRQTYCTYQMTCLLSIILKFCDPGQDWRRTCMRYAQGPTRARTNHKPNLKFGLQLPFNQTIRGARAKARIDLASSCQQFILRV